MQEGGWEREERERQGEKEGGQHMHIRHAHMCVALHWNHSILLGLGQPGNTTSQTDTHDIRLQTYNYSLGDEGTVIEPAGIHQQPISRTFHSIELY